MPRNTSRTAYCHQQAAECASAASATVLAEVREAYLNMEQAWLQLAPDIDSNQSPPVASQADQQRSKTDTLT